MGEKRGLVPYGLVSPGFEAVYTGEKSDSFVERVEGPMRLVADDSGNVMRVWSVWTWTWPGQERDWDDEIKYINNMQMELGRLDDETRRIRAHIGSLVPCDNGFPVTVDELLGAIGSGKLGVPSFHNGCWMGSMWWDTRSTQPFDVKAIQTIYDVLKACVESIPKDELLERFPYARGFIERTYEWLGPVEKLTRLQRLMIERMLLPFDFFTKRNRDYAEVNRECFEEGGRGFELDAEISALAGLPKIHRIHLREYRETLEKISGPEKRDLYMICCHIASGVHELSDCHHNMLRYFERWIYGIGTGGWGIPARRSGMERKRLGQLLFGYCLGLDRWLLGIPMHFAFLDLGYVDLGSDPKNEILRVYAYLGEERTPVKMWLTACLWHNLCHNMHGGLLPFRGPWRDRRKDLVERAHQQGISTREWIDSALENNPIETITDDTPYASRLS
ncbi:MAG: hypothetical protein ACETWE_14735 [Candidatus Bathyarchaeia archaeon]